MQPDHLVDRWSTALRCLPRTGDIGMTLRYDRVAYPFLAALLGGVKWRKDIYSIKIVDPFMINYNPPLLGMVVKCSDACLPIISSPVC